MWGLCQVGALTRMPEPVQWNAAAARQRTSDANTPRTDPRVNGQIGARTLTGARPDHPGQAT